MNAECSCADRYKQTSCPGDSQHCSNSFQSSNRKRALFYTINGLILNICNIRGLCLLVNLSNETCMRPEFRITWQTTWKDSLPWQFFIKRGLGVASVNILSAHTEDINLCWHNVDLWCLFPQHTTKQHAIYACNRKYVPDRTSIPLLSTDYFRTGSQFFVFLTAG